jgi:hypothetical protein
MDGKISAGQEGRMQKGPPLPPENPVLSPEDLAEARRIAGELVKLHGDGAIKSERDAPFYAKLVRDFGATYTGTPCDEAAIQSAWAAET